MMSLVRTLPSLDGREMKFYAYRSESFMDRMEYIGTWYANTYDADISMIVNETGIDIGSLKIFGRIA